MQEKPISGHPDNSTQKDLFEITSYIKGLRNFIYNCNTPMTIAVQGDWGSGKTSLMELVKDQLPPDIISININTWQYSQFELDEKLSVIFLQSLIEQLAKDQTSNINPKTKAAISDALSSVLIIGAGILGGSNGSKLAEKTINNLSAISIVQVIDKLKAQFQKIIHSRCDNEGKSRVVFFIDDLDRLQPEKAVELMEILKIFLDCERCVFILAIDYNVVSQGVKSKYKGMDDIKARSFFDKIIQVPFTMPVGRYNINNYIRELLKLSGLEGTFNSLENKEGVIQDVFVDLVRYTVGSNPRSIKRLINTYALLVSILGSQSEEKASKEYMSVMFATICGQLSYEKLYNHLLELSSSREGLGNFLTDIMNNDDKSLRENTIILEKLGLSNASDLQINEIINYIDKLIEIVNEQSYLTREEDDNEKEAFALSDKALTLLAQTLQMSATTATNPHQESSAGDYFDAKITYIHDVVRIVVEKTGGDSKKIDRGIITTAIKECAEKNGVTQSTIADKCGRLLKCSTQDFQNLCKDFLENNREKLILQINATNKNKMISYDNIKTKFLSI